jgi:hypothetical protein
VPAPRRSVLIVRSKRIVRNHLVRRIDTHLRSGRRTMLLVVGHMRSGSSLLVHILASNPEIIGYGETHHRYRTPEDFADSAFEICRSFGRLWPRERYLLDKVLHGYVGLTAPLLTARSTRTILLVRRPEEALRSILRKGGQRIYTPEEALRYYADRLEEVQRLADSLGGERCILVRYDELVEDTDATLQRLSHFLRLAEPLREEYETMWSTGRPKIGDTSERIHQRRIVRQPSEHPTEFPEPLMDVARDAYQRCVDGSRDRLGLPAGGGADSP